MFSVIYETIDMVLKSVKIKATSPTRIDFTGGFTDVLPFRCNQWVEHINLAVDMSTTIVLEGREDRKIRISGNNQVTIAEYQSREDISERFSLIKNAIYKFNIEDGLSVHIESKAPIGAGLGTSGAFCVALASSLTLLCKQKLPNNLAEIALLAAEIERDSGMLTGVQDEFASVFGGLNSFHFFNAEYLVKPIRLGEDQIKDLEKSLYILFPGGKRQSTPIINAVMDAYARNDHKVVTALHSLNKLAIKIRETLQRMDLVGLSELLGLVRREQLKLHPKLIGEGNCKIINELQNQGVDGVKLLGGGGDGACLLVLCTDKKSRQIVMDISHKYGITVLPVCVMKSGVQTQTISHQ